MEDIVSKNETGRVVADEFLADDEGLCKAVGRGLFGIFEFHTVVRAIAQQALEAGEVMGGRDDEDVAYTGQHEGRYGVVDHRFVKHGKHLLAHTLGDGVQACAGASGKYNSFHIYSWLAKAFVPQR